MTNSEIISIATYNRIKKKLLFEKNELIRAVRYYHEGECSEFL